MIELRLTTKENTKTGKVEVGLFMNAHAHASEKEKEVVYAFIKGLKSVSESLRRKHRRSYRLMGATVRYSDLQNQP